METVTLTYGGLSPIAGSVQRAGIDPRPLTWRGRVEEGGEFALFLSFSDVAWRLGEADQVLAAMAAWTVAEIEARIQAGEHESLTGVEAINLTLPHERLGEVTRFMAGADKHCRWQNERRGALYCSATVPPQNAATTRALCGGCGMPDERFICSELVHPEVVWGPGRTRQPTRVLCGVGRDADDGARCRPGGLACWRREVRSGTALPDVPGDLPRLAADELDYLRLVMRDRYPAIGDVLSIPQARSVAELFGECTSAEDLQLRLASLADLLSRVRVHESLPEEDRVDGENRRVGSLVALERLMARDYPEAVSAVELLRWIPKARTAFPIHSRTQGLLEAFRGLGIDYPTDDWDFAWRQALRTFWAAIRDVRRSVQASEPRGPIT